MNVRPIPTLAALALLALIPGCSKDSPTAPTPPPPTDVIAGEVAVTLLPGVSPSALVADYGGRVLTWESAERCLLLEVPDSLSDQEYVLTCAGDPRCVTSEQNGFLEPAEARQQSFAFDDGRGTLQTYSEQSAVRVLGLAAAHAVSTGSGVVVAVLDTGIDPTHPAFAGRLVPGRDFIGRDTDPTDTTNGTDDDGDGYVDEAWGHGTHVAGIVTLAAPGASIMPVRVLDADGRGNVVGVAAGIRWAVANGADVINLSLGTLKGSDMIQDALEDAEDAGIVVIASAGNWGAEQPREFPATSSHAHAVAACDTLAVPAPFTSYGSHVDLCAPGVGIRSAYPGGAWRLWSGTSMSAPFVAGAAALVRAQNPSWTNDEVMERVGDTCRAMTIVNPAQRGRLGHGMLHASAAVGAPAPASPLARR